MSEPDGMKSNTPHWGCEMTKAQKQERILAAIASRGRFTAEIYLDEARELSAAGKIRLGDYYSVGGNRKPCWVAA